MDERKFLETIIKTQLAISEANTVDRLDLTDDEKLTRKMMIADRLQKEAERIHEDLSKSHVHIHRPGSYH